MKLLTVPEQPMAETVLEALSREECLALLATKDVGRLAVVVDHYPQVFPVNYQVDDWVVVFRTDPGTKLDAAHHQNVAFEVDHLDPETRTGWSVLVQGMGEDVTDHQPDAVTRRANALQIAPWAGGEKPRFVRVIPARITGRRLVPAV